MNTTPEEIPLTIAERKAIKKRREGTTVVFFIFCVFAYYMYDKMKLDMIAAIGNQAVINIDLDEKLAAAAAARAQAQLYNSGVSTIS